MNIAPSLLLIDDDKGVTESIVTFFEKKGISTNVVNDAKSAVEAYKTSSPTLVLLDHNLGETTGDKVALQLKEFDDNAKIIVTSGNIIFSQEAESNYEKAGIVGKYIKGSGSDTLVREIHKCFKCADYVPNFGSNSTDATIQNKDSILELLHGCNNNLQNVLTSCLVVQMNLEKGFYEDLTKEEVVEKVLAALIKTSCEGKKVAECIRKTQKFIDGAHIQELM